MTAATNRKEHRMRRLAAPVTVLLVLALLASLSGQLVWGDTIVWGDSIIWGN